MDQAENYTPPSTANAAAFDIGYNFSLHGNDGPIHVSYSEYIYPQSSMSTIVEQSAVFRLIF